jgi:integrase
VRAALLTGCRAGELLALRARDYDHASQMLGIAQSKSGKGRQVPLTKEGADFFAGVTAGLPEDAPLFTHGGGEPWNRMAVSRQMALACNAAKVAAANFHALRHTYASLLVQQGVPLMHVAAALGHTDTRMVEKHYGHLGPNAVADAIRANLPTFGEPQSSAVTDLRRKSNSEVDAIRALTELTQPGFIVAAGALSPFSSKTAVAYGLA